MSRSGPLHGRSLCGAVCPCVILFSVLNVLQKIPHYSPSVCYQYQTFASPRHYYTEQEERGRSPPLEVSDGEEEYEGHKLSPFRKETSKYSEFGLKTSPRGLRGFMNVC